MSLRDSIFALCKKIQKSEESNELRKLIHSLNVYVEGQSFPNRSDFGYASRHSHNQFYGYLFTDENIELYKTDSIFKNMTPLSNDERTLVERGQATIELLISECLKDIAITYPTLCKTLNPYSRFKPIREVNAVPFVTKEDIIEVVEEFRNTPAYLTLASSPLSQLIKSITEEQHLQLIELLTKEIVAKPFDVVSDDIKNLALRRVQQKREPTDALFQDSCLILSLREMLKILAQLVFTAVVGGDLIVLNNDNIIHIEEKASNLVYDYMTVLTQNLAPVYNVDTIGAILLIDCDPSKDYHIHDFGVIRSETLSMTQDTGWTAKLSFAIIDEHLNPLSNLIK